MKCKGKILLTAIVTTCIGVAVWYAFWPAQGTSEIIIVVPQITQALAEPSVPSQAPPRGSESAILAPDVKQAEPTPQATPSIVKTADGVIGTLTINGKTVSIMDNVEEDALIKSPGWMPDSALPGAYGMSVILGHRNRGHLRMLEDTKVGDAIIFEYATGGCAVYTVAEIIVEETGNWHLQMLEGNTLVLVTCYPFRYTGHAPGKYIVIGEKA